MIDYTKWPNGAVAIAIDEESMLMRFVLADGSAICGQNRVIHYADSDYKTTIATREPENKGYQLADGSWSSEYEVGDWFCADSNSNWFQGGGFVQLCLDDGSNTPRFTDGVKTLHENWEFMTPCIKKPTSTDAGVEGVKPEPITNTKHLEFMHACYVRGYGYDDAEFLWELKNT